MGVGGGWMTWLNIAEHIWDVALMINGGVRGSSNTLMSEKVMWEWVLLPSRSEQHEVLLFGSI